MLMNEVSCFIKVDEIFRKLWYSLSAEMTPLKLLTMHKDYVEGTVKKVVKHRGLVTSHDKLLRQRRIPTTAPDYTSKRKKVKELNHQIFADKNTNV